MGEWREYRIGDIGTFSYGKMPQKDILNTGVYPTFSGYKYQYTYPEFNCKKNDLIVVARGVGGTGDVKIVKEDCYLTNLSLKMIFDKEMVDSTFIYYYYFIETLRYLDSGSAQSQITINDLSNAYISLPPLKEQKAIAEVLSSLDDKIDLLHRQNKTLEKLAQTLFRQWFIEEAEEGWEVVSLEYFADNPRKSIKPFQITSDIKYIGLEHIERKNISLMKSGKAENVASNKYEFEENDILFGKLRPYFHKVCFTAHRGICSTDILVIHPKEARYFAFTLFAFFQEDVVNYANSGSEGTRMPRTNWSMLSQYPIQIPDEKRLDEFNQIVLPTLDKIKENQQQIKTLETLRDTLLPKLMSGKVRI